MKYKKGDRVWIINHREDDIILEGIKATNLNHQYIYGGRVFLFGEGGVFGEGSVIGYA